MTDALFLGCVDGATVGGEVLVSGSESHHAVTVRRLRVGEPVIVADGAGAGVRGKVVQADKQGLRVRVEELLQEHSSPLRVVAVQALAKGDRADVAIEAMTELGVGEIVPWQSSRAIVRWSDGERGAKQHSRWVATVREASKQARRLTIPEVAPAYSTMQVCARISSVASALVLHEDATEWLAECGLPAAGDVMIIIGPEGGISPDELDAFCTAGARPVRIADHVLRTSTAGVVACAQIQALTQTR